MTRRKPERWLLKRLTAGFAVAVGLLGADFSWNLPTGFPRPAVPADNPMSAAKVELGHPNRSRILRPLRLTDGDKRDLVEFLKSLTDEDLLHDPRWSDPWTAVKGMAASK